VGGPSRDSWCSWSWRQRGDAVICEVSGKQAWTHGPKLPPTGVTSVHASWVRTAPLPGGGGTASHAPLVDASEEAVYWRAPLAAMVTTRLATHRGSPSRGSAHCLDSATRAGRLTAECSGDACEAAVVGGALREHDCVHSARRSSKRRPVRFFSPSSNGKFSDREQRPHDPFWPVCGCCFPHEILPCEDGDTSSKRPGCGRASSVGVGAGS
jgi:hypothetical protein